MLPFREILHKQWLEPKTSSGTCVVLLTHNGKGFILVGMGLCVGVDAQWKRFYPCWNGVLCVCVRGYFSLPCDFLLGEEFHPRQFQ